MPRYFVDTFDGTAVLDDVGTEFPDLDAARDYVRLVLARMMSEEVGIRRSAKCRANVRDASGRQVLEASLVLTVTAETRT